MKIPFRETVSIGFCLIVLILMASTQTRAQAGKTDEHDLYVELSEIVLMDVEPDNSTILLDLVTTNEDGSTAISDVATDDSKWINYSCSLAPNSSPRTIYAQITQGSVPAGLTLKLRALEAGYGGLGDLGVSTGTIVLNGYPQAIIQGIGGSLTGDGIDRGHQLYYLLYTDENEPVSSGGIQELEITFTISE
ncbi:MAG: hypothetical protein R3350_03205 [Saprospiraceae bacterium]|nr:hypothetical protein [Saprospiraceae bacterium]